MMARVRDFAIADCVIFGRPYRAVYEGMRFPELALRAIIARSYGASADVYASTILLRLLWSFRHPNLPCRRTDATLHRSYGAFVDVYAFGMERLWACAAVVGIKVFPEMPQGIPGKPSTQNLFMNVLLLSVFD